MLNGGEIVIGDRLTKGRNRGIKQFEDVNSISIYGENIGVSVNRVKEADSRFLITIGSLPNHIEIVVDTAKDEDGNDKVVISQMDKVNH